MFTTLSITCIWKSHVWHIRSKITPSLTMWTLESHSYIVPFKCRYHRYTWHAYNKQHFHPMMSFKIACEISWNRVTLRLLTHSNRDEIDNISQTTFSNVFSSMKMFELRLKFHWSLFLRVQLPIFQHWLRQWLGTVQATSHYLNQWWLVYRRIYAALCLNELIWYPFLLPSCAVTWGLVCQKQVSRAGTSNYIRQTLWDVITCPCPWYLLLAHRFSYDLLRIHGCSGPPGLLISAKLGNKSQRTYKTMITWLLCHITPQHRVFGGNYDVNIAFRVGDNYVITS